MAVCVYVCGQVCVNKSMYGLYGASLVAQLVRNPPAMQEAMVHFLGQEDPLEKG